jgi:hypothetical protein
LIYFATPLLSQVAINSTGADPHLSAILDINSNDKGILLPRLVITDVDSDMSPVESPARGLLIYNTGSPVAEEGYYNWSGDRWVQIISSNSSLSIEQTATVYESAELYEVNEHSSPTIINLPNREAYYGWSQAVEGTLFGSMSTDVDNPGGSRIIVGETGLYQVIISASFGGTNNNIVTGSVFHTPDGGTPEITRVRLMSKIHSAGDVVSASAHGVLYLQKNDAIDLRFTSAGNGEHVKVYNLNLSCTKVGN